MSKVKTLAEVLTFTAAIMVFLPAQAAETPDLYASGVLETKAGLQIQHADFEYGELSLQQNELLTYVKGWKGGGKWYKKQRKHYEKAFKKYQKAYYKDYYRYGPAYPPPYGAPYYGPAYAPPYGSPYYGPSPGMPPYALGPNYDYRFPYW